MNNEYSFNSRVVEDAIVNLKSAFFDIYSHQTSALANLQSNLDRLNPNSRSKAEALIIAQSEKLSRSMLVLNEMIRDIESVNENGLKVEKLLSSGKGVAKPNQMVKKAAAIPVEEKTNEVVTEAVQAPAAEVKTEPATEASVEVTTEAVTEAVQVPTTEVKTEPVTEVSTEVATEAATEAVQVPATEVKTEPVTEASTEVVTEAATEAVQVPAVEEKTESVAEVSTEVATEAVTEAVQVPVVEEKTESVAEVSTEVATETVAESANDEPVIIPVADNGDGSSIFDMPVTEPTKEKEYIADTPEQANLDMFNMFKALPGMEKMKMNSDGKPDFSGMFSKETMQKLSENSDGSLSGIISAIAKENRARNGIVDPVLPVIPTEDSTMEDNGEISTEVSTEAVANEEQSTEVQQEVSEQQVIIPTVAPPAPPVASVIPVVDTNDITTEVSSALEGVDVGSEVTTEAAIATDNLVIPVVAESTDNQDAVISTDAISSAVDEAVQEVVADETGYRRFIDSGSQAKAILVSDVQYNKLMSSCVTQEALLKFKKVLPDLTAPVKVTTDDTADMSDDDKRKTIEAMMADANALYNAGKVDEAQAMYDKISELNKTLVKS